jgi:nicotinamide mononucleotide (NMN) deamidase PncC
MELVERFLQVGIANHQAISACYTKYMVTNSQAAEVKKLTVKVAEMEEERKAVNKSIALLEKKVANLQSTADKALSIANGNGRPRGGGTRE